MQLLQHFKELTLRPKNAQELKDLILKLAVQGKLTSNWRLENIEIENASILFDKIQTNKKLLVKLKKIKKLNILPAIEEDEIPYELPVSWIWKRFDSIVINRDGERKPITKSDRVSGSYDYYGASGVIDKVADYIFDKDLLLIGEDGANLINRSTPIAFFARGKYWVNNHAHVLDACYPEILEYLAIYINSINLEEYITGMAQPKMPQKRMNLIKVPLPPLEEQREIVKVVEILFKEVEQLEQLTVKRITLKEDFVTSALNQLTTNNAKQEWTFLQDHFKSFFNETTNIKKLRETVLQLAVQGKLTADWRANNPDTEDASVLLKLIQKEKAQLVKDKKIKKEKALPLISKEDIPYELPEGWVWCKLQDLVNVGTGSTPATSNSSYYGGEIPWYTSSATNDLFAKESEKLITEKALKETNCKVFPEGTLIIAMYGQGKTRGQISELVIPGATNQAVAAMVFYKNSKDFKEYIKYFFRKIYDEIRLLAEGGAQPNLNVGKIKNTILPVPPLEEQKAIVEKVNALMGLCDALDQEVQQSQEHSEQLMQSVLREVFEGEKEAIV